MQGLLSFIAHRLGSIDQAVSEAEGFSGCEVEAVMSDEQSDMETSPGLTHLADHGWGLEVID